MTQIGLVLLGLVAGVFSGLFGIGGGLIIVPALLILFKMRDMDAVATSLAALIPPVGLLGAWRFYEQGHINIRYAALIAAGMFVGAYFGAGISLSLEPSTVRRLYGIFLALIALRMLIVGK